MKWTQLPSVPDREGFASPFAGVSGRALLVAGGANFPGKRPWENGIKVWYDNIFALTASDGEWLEVGRLPKPCAYGVSITYDDSVICAGGSDAGGHFGDVYRIKWNGGSMQSDTLPSLPKPCANACGALSGDVFYLAGGIDAPDSTQALHAFWALNLTKIEDGWVELPPWPGCGRMLSVAAVSQGEFYIIGGVALRAGVDAKPVREPALKDCYAYSPEKGWRRIADMTPRAAVAAPSPAPIAPDGRILICTGDDGLRAHLNGPDHPGFSKDIMAYDPVLNCWMDAGTMPFSRATVPTTIWQDCCVIVNGERKPGYRSPEVWGLNFSV